MSSKTKKLIIVIIAIFLVVSGILAFAFISNHYYKKENKQLIKDNIVKGVVVDTLADTVQKNEQTNESTDKVVTEAVQKIRDNDKTDTVIRGKLKQKINAINNSKKTIAADKTLSAETIAQKEAALDRERSRAYIDNLWEHYCISIDFKDEKCTPNKQESK